MYPAEYLSLFPAFPRKNEVFVAMSFSKEFNFRWERVVKPTIERLSYNDNRLVANRVDTRIVSDSILTEILTGISQSRLFFADISTIGFVLKRAVRNANVLYEVGIAHATRLPEEVLLFRSDRDPLIFDVANIRVNTYDPDRNTAEAGEKVASAVASSLNEIDLKRHLSVQHLAETLD